MSGLDPFSVTWQLTQTSMRILGMGARLAGKAAGSTRAGVSRASVQREINRSQQVTASGILGPGDPPPVAGARGSFLDYRGLAGIRDVGGLVYRGGSMPFRAGQYLDVRRGPLGPLAIPFPVLQRHASVIGPPGSGKTAGLLVPWIYSALANGHSVIAVDVKGDLLDDIRAYARSLGTGRLGIPIAKWDFTHPAKSRSWSWLDELTDSGSLDAAVTAILGRENPNSSQDPFFYRRDAMILRGLLQAARLLAGSYADAGGLLDALSDQDRILDAIQHHPNSRGITELANSLLGIDRSEYPRQISGVTTALARLDDPGFAAVTQPSPFRLNDVLTTGQLLVVAAPLRQGETSRMASALVLNLLVQRLYSRFNGAGSAQRQVFLVIDEAPRIVDKFNFEEVLSVARSAGVSVVVAAQDVAQFKDENERSAILGNCATMFTLAGASPKTTEYLRSRLGSHTMPVLMTSAQAQRGVSPSVSRSMQSGPVLGDREIAQPPFGPRCAVVHVNATDQGITTKPALVDLSL